MRYPTFPSSLNFVSHGAQRFDGAVANDLPVLHLVLKDQAIERAGVRIAGLDALNPLIMPGGSIAAIATAQLGLASRPVRAILFDKNAETNWTVAWHQDRTICVKQRVDAMGFGPWTMKQGMQHVAPPSELLARMVTIRVHLDPVLEDNAPLLIAPGSHTIGSIPIGAIKEVVRRCGSYTCIANAGDVWLYSTPIVHASRVATKPTHRRVLQLDYAAEELPAGLQWFGV
jgi:hypothetical protein